MLNAILRDDFAYIASFPFPWNLLYGKTILISGANGFLASYLTKFILFLNERKIGKPINVIGIVRNKKKAQEVFFDYKKCKDLIIVENDVNIPIKIKRTIHYIVHAASQASPKYYYIDPVGTLKANIIGTYNLLELARKNPVESFLFISGGEIYGNIESRHLPMDEINYGSLDPLDVRSCYAESKRTGETMCKSWFHQYRVPTKIMRLFHTYGPGIRLDDGRVFADFIANILRSENMIMKSDGSAVRSFNYIADSITGLFTVLLKGKKGEAYNVGSDIPISIKKLADVLVSLYPEKKLKIITEKRKKSDSYIPSKFKVIYPSTSKIVLLGWKTKYSLLEGFKRTIESYTKL